MDRSAAPFRACKGGATEAQSVVTRRTMLSGVAGLAMLASVRSGFGKAAAENAYQGRNGTMDIKRNGSRPSGKGPEAWFTGTVRVDPIFQVGDPARLRGGQVTFEPGARTMWHTHPLGQTLIVTSGLGWVQCEGGPIEEIRPGDVIWFPRGRSTGMARQRRPRWRISLLRNRSTARTSNGWKRSPTSNTANDFPPRRSETTGHECVVRKQSRHFPSIASAKGELVALCPRGTCMSKVTRSPPSSWKRPRSERWTRPTSQGDQKCRRASLAIAALRSRPSA